jgi:hypothetical protein
MNQFKIVYQIFFIIFFFFSGIMAFAQNDPLEKKATLSVQKESLENVLASITKQTGVRFSYNSQLVDPKTSVTVQAQNKTVREILSTILPATISYKKVGIYIVFSLVKEGNQISDNRQAESRKQKAEIEKKSFSDNETIADSCLISISTKNIDSIRTENEEMTKYIAELTPTDTTETTFVFAKDTQNVKIQEENIDFQEECTSKKSKPIQVSFVYPIGTDWGQTAENSYQVSINVLGGVTGQTKGVEIGGVYNINRYSSNAQVAGIFNQTQKGKSMQFTSIFNVGDTSCVQAAGIWNFANQSHCQIGGVVNITKKGKFQMGLVNVRDTADGVSLGLINIVKQGGIMEAGIESDEFVHTSLTLRTGVKRLYTIVSIGYNYTDYFWSVSSGLGTSIKLIENLNINFEVTYETLNDNVLGWYSLTQFSPVLNYRFAKCFKIYLGPSLNLHVQNDYFKRSETRRFVNIPYSFFNQTFNYLWVGIVGEIKFKRSYIPTARTFN